MLGITILLLLLLLLLRYELKCCKLRCTYLYCSKISTSHLKPSNRTSQISQNITCLHCLDYKDFSFAFVLPSPHVRSLYPHLSHPSAFVMNGVDGERNIMSPSVWRKHEVPRSMTCAQVSNRIPMLRLGHPPTSYHAC